MDTSLTKQIYPLPASVLLSSIYLKRKFFSISFFFLPPTVYDVDTSRPSDSSYHHAKVSWLLNAYCATSDNHDNTSGHLLVLSSFLQHEGLWQVRTHFTVGTERKPHFARAAPTCWQGATNQINPYPFKEQARCAKETTIARDGHFYF